MRLSERRLVQASTATGIAVGALVFWSVLLDFGTDIGRSALAVPYAANFFETQADAFLDGRLSVPGESLGIEGFQRDGKTYMYFGPFPALLRIPILLVTHDFDGRLTLASMGLAWIVLAAMLARLLWLVRARLVPDRPVGRIDAALGAIVLASATGGTTLTYDAALPWVYHEVYLWQTAFVITAAYLMLRMATEPSNKILVWLGLMAAGACLTRTTGGLAVCIGIGALAAWLRWGNQQRDHRDWALKTLLAALIPLVIGAAVNIAKFDHPFLFPLEDQVWTDLNERRQQALEINGGTITGPQFFSTTLINYFRPDGIRFTEWFPWISLPAEPAPAYHGAFIDQSYRTGSVTSFMTLLLLLTVLCLPVLARRNATREVNSLRAPALAVFAIWGGVMAYGYLTHRYTSEFVPALIFGALLGTWGVVSPAMQRGTAWARRLRVPVLAGMAALTVFGLLAHVAIGFSAAAQVHRGAPLERYVAVQDELSGGPGSALSRMITASDALPEGGRTDQLHIRGDCEGLYLNTGDQYEPWVPVEERSHVVEVYAEQGYFRPARISIFDVQAAEQDNEIFVESDGEGQVRVGISNAGGEYYGPYFRPVDEPARIAVRIDSGLGHGEVTSSPGGFVGYVRTQTPDGDWIFQPGAVNELLARPIRRPAAGLEVSPGTPVPLTLCNRIAKHNNVDLVP